GWGADDPRRSQLATCLAERFPTLSEQGHRTALDLLEVLLQSPQAQAPESGFVSAISKLLSAVAHSANSQVHARALSLAAVHLTRFHEPQIQACRELIRTALGDEAPANRVQAI